MSTDPAWLRALVQSDGVALCLQCVCHENGDIAGVMMDVLGEMMEGDHDILDEEREGKKLVAEKLLEEENLEILLENLKRAQEEKDAEQVGVILRFFENLLELTKTNVLAKSGFFTFVMERIALSDEHHLHASELFSIMAADAPPQNVNWQLLFEMIGCDKEEEEEYVKNLIDGMASIFMHQEIVLEESMLLLINLIKKEKTREEGLRALDLALMSAEENSTWFVKSGGLKNIFAVMIIIVFVIFCLFLSSNNLEI